jgi:hypothetical protein
MIEIPTVKWKEDGLLVGARTSAFSRDRRVINRPLRIRERLLQNRALISVVDQRKSISAGQGLSELALKINTEEDGDSSFGLYPRRSRLVQAS